MPHATINSSTIPVFFIIILFLFVDCIIGLSIIYITEFIHAEGMIIITNDPFLLLFKSTQCVFPQDNNANKQLLFSRSTSNPYTRVFASQSFRYKQSNLIVGAGKQRTVGRLRVTVIVAERHSFRSS